MHKLTTAAATALLAGTLAASPAQAAGWNTVHLMSGGNCVTSSCWVNWSKVDPYVPYSVIPRGGTASGVSCFRPSTDLWSYWNGYYAAGEIRCFGGSGSTLTLYGYRH